MAFPDGKLPSKELIKKWLQVVDDFFTPGSTFGELPKGGAGAAAIEGGEPTVAIEKRSS